MKLIKNTILATGFLAGIGVFFKKVFSGRDVQAQVQLKAADLNQTRNGMQKQLDALRKEVAETTRSLPERQLAALLLDSAGSGMQLLDLVKVDAKILKNGYKISRLQKLFSYFLGRGITFLLTLASFFFLIYMKWNCELGSSADTLSLLNASLVISGAAMLHSLGGLLFQVISYQKQTKSEITVGVDVDIPEEQQKLYLQRLEQNLRLSCKTAFQQLESAKKNEMDNNSLLSFAEIYQYLYEARKLEDMSNIGGYILPECQKLLSEMGIRIITEYTGETAYLFSVIEAPDAGSSFVLKPALLLKDAKTVLLTGEYVKA